MIGARRLPVRFGIVRLAAAAGGLTAGLALAVAPSLSAAASDQETAKAMVGSWSCVSAKEQKEMRITFKPDGSVAGQGAGQELSGHYLVQSGVLSIVGPGEFITATALRIRGRTASASIVNGDTIRCTRL